MDPDVTWETGRGCPPVVQYWADLKLVHEFVCYDNIAPNAKCQRVLVLALCLVVLVREKAMQLTEDDAFRLLYTTELITV